MEDIVRVDKLGKIFKSKAGEVVAVDTVSMTARKGEVTTIVGPSGSGKTTLLYLIGSLEAPDSGSIKVSGEEITGSEADLVKYRKERVGFVFQFFNLVSSLNATENVSLPMDLAGVSAKDQHLRAVELLEKMGIGGRLQKTRTNKMSGGEKQRVAIARAIANDPEIILADEPTGNLDTLTGENVVKILVDLAHNDGKCVLIVTHDESILDVSDKAFHMTDGRLTSIK